jgi:hypothetical protein
MQCNGLGDLNVSVLVGREAFFSVGLKNFLNPTMTTKPLYCKTPLTAKQGVIKTCSFSPNWIVPLDGLLATASCGKEGNQFTSAPANVKEGSQDKFV